MTPMERQRAARLARDAHLAQEAARKAHRESAAGFWDNVDTSAGLDACHPWQGERSWNHPDPGCVRYERGVFRGYDGADSYFATRVACFARFGKPVPKGMDVTPICGDHLCMNVRHFAIVAHGGNGDKRINRAIPAAEFFCQEVTSGEDRKAA